MLPFHLRLARAILRFGIRTINDRQELADHFGHVKRIYEEYEALNYNKDNLLEHGEKPLGFFKRLSMFLNDLNSQEYIGEVIENKNPLARGILLLLILKSHSGKRALHRRFLILR